MACTASSREGNNHPFSSGVDQAPIGAFRISTFASATVTSSTPARHNPSSRVAPHHQTPPRHGQTPAAAPSPCRARPPRTRQRGAGRGKGLSGGGGLKVHCGRHRPPEAPPSRPPDGRTTRRTQSDSEFRIGVSTRSFDSEFRLGVSTRRATPDSDRHEPTQTDSGRHGPALR